jgi:hypothetical protein
MTDVFGKFVQRLAQMYCLGPSGSALEMEVTVEYVGRKPPTASKGIQKSTRGGAA